jgi:hypothetical protein
MACDPNSVRQNPPTGADPSPIVFAEASFEGSFDPFEVFNDLPEIAKCEITIVADPTAPDGSSVVSISHEPGVKDGSFTGGLVLAFPDEAQPTELWVQFYVKFSDNYVWHSIGNKLIYMRMGRETAIGKVFQTNHFLGVNNQWVDGPNIGWSTQHSTNSKLNQTIYQECPEFKRGEWQKIVFQIKMNQPGKYDGIGRIWLNDALIVDASDIMWLNARNSGGIADFAITPLWGGGGPEVVMVTQFVYFDHVIIQTGPF